MRRLTLLLSISILFFAGCSSQPSSKRVEEPKPNRNNSTVATNEQPKPSTYTNVNYSIEEPDAEVISLQANLRELPNSSSNVVTIMDEGEKLLLVREKSIGAWFEVKQLSTGKTGWIHGNTIKLLSTDIQEVSSMDAADVLKDVSYPPYPVVNIPDTSTSQATENESTQQRSRYVGTPSQTNSTDSYSPSDSYNSPSYNSNSSYGSYPSYTPNTNSTYKPPVAENGSYYGEISEKTGRPKTVHVNGYYRKDGTYVRGHYRSKPRRN